MTYFAAPGVINYEYKALTIEDIEKYVCSYYGINPEEIHLGPGKKGIGKTDIVLCRQMTIYLCLQLLETSTTILGKYFDRDHSTIIKSKQTIQHRSDVEEKIIFDIKNIKYNLHYRLFD